MNITIIKDDMEEKTTSRFTKRLSEALSVTPTIVRLKYQSLFFEETMTFKNLITIDLGNKL